MTTKDVNEGLMPVRIAAVAMFISGGAVGGALFSFPWWGWALCSVACGTFGVWWFWRDL